MKRREFLEREARDEYGMSAEQAKACVDAVAQAHPLLDMTREVDELFGLPLPPFRHANGQTCHGCQTCFASEVDA